MNIFEMLDKAIGVQIAKWARERSQLTVDVARLAELNQLIQNATDERAALEARRLAKGP